MPYKTEYVKKIQKNLITNLYDPRMPKPVFNHRSCNVWGYGCSVCEPPPDDPDSNDDEAEVVYYKPRKVYRDKKSLCEHILKHHNLKLCDSIYEWISVPEKQ